MSFEDEDRHGGGRVEAGQYRQQGRVPGRPGVALLQQALESRGGRAPRGRPRRRGIAAAPSQVSGGVVVVVVMVEQAADEVERQRVGVVTEVRAAHTQRPGQQLHVRHVRALYIIITIISIIIIISLINTADKTQHDKQ